MSDGRTMTIQKAYRFRLDPTWTQRSLMRQFAGCRRWVWNEALRLQKVRLDAGLGVMSYVEMCRLLTHWRRTDETRWLSDAPVHTSQQSLRDLRRALDDFFDEGQPRKRFPRFKRRGINDSFRYPDPNGFDLDQENDRIKLPKLGWVRYRNSRCAEGELRNVTVSREGKHWFVAIQVEAEIDEPTPPESEVGVDLGVTRFATLSTGEFFEPLNALRSKMRRLKRLQRQLSRKTKGSNNWKEQKARIARLHRRIHNARDDFLHKVTARLAKNHGVVVVEDLRVQDMSRSARGDTEDHGSGVRAKAALNRAILDQGWGEFVRQLGYKLDWNGGDLILVDPAHTSQRCAECDHVSAENRPTQARFECQECGHEDHADVNAAMNILAAGRAATARGGQPEVGAPEKREPARTVA